MKVYDCELKDGSIILNPDGDFEIVEFFDYNCIHCKAQFKVLRELMQNKDKKVRLVIKPIPVLGKLSSYATQIGYGIIMSEPEKFTQYIESMMNNTIDDGNQIKRALQDSKADIEKLKKVLIKEKDSIVEMIKSNLSIAREIGIIGAPAFLINGKLRLGELNIQDFETEINKNASI